MISFLLFFARILDDVSIGTRLILPSNAKPIKKMKKMKKTTCF